MVWDQGIYEIIGQGTAEVQLKAGKFSFILKGKKLSGRFTLTRLPRGETEKEWLIIKNKDEYADSAWTLRSELTPQRLRGLAIKVPPCDSP